MTFKNIIRTIATGLVLTQGLYYATTQPGPMDLFNGLVGGFVLYCIWRRDDL